MSSRYIPAPLSVTTSSLDSGPTGVMRMRASSGASVPCSMLVMIASRAF